MNAAGLLAYFRFDGPLQTLDALEPIAEGLLMGPDSGMLSALLDEMLVEHEIAG